MSESDDSPLTGEQAIILLDTIPGVEPATGEILLAEIGLDLSRFQSAAHLVKWAKLCPGITRVLENVILLLFIF